MSDTVVSADAFSSYGSGTQLNCAVSCMSYFSVEFTELSGSAASVLGAQRDLHRLVM